jgi:two-component system sensor histidine kinase RegB
MAQPTVVRVAALPESPLQALAPRRVTTPSDTEAKRIQMAWLVRLRWGALLGQFVTVLLVDLGMHIELPLLALLIVLGGEAISNVAFAVWARRTLIVRDWALAIPMVLDIMLLTVLLFLTGGPFNPFSFLYLVHIALAAVVLSARLTWGLVALSLVCFGSLFVEHTWLPMPMPTQLSHADQMRMHMQGMWFAFAVAAGFITYFVTRVRQSLELREAELARAHTLASQGEKLASLATLATGAAHELSTPLSTIAVIAKELERALVHADETARNDARLIRREVERCREILQRMAADSGMTGEGDKIGVSVRDLLATAFDGLPNMQRLRLEIAADATDSVLHAPPLATAQALRGVLKNALQASAHDSHVDVKARLVHDGCEIRVRDFGAGMTGDVLARAGEPFFTTKEPGEGMGLGLFLTRVVIERAGGRVLLESKPGRGTTARVTLPLMDATNHRIRV